MLVLLRDMYPDLGRPSQEMKAAAENGRAGIVFYLLRHGRVGREGLIDAFAAAAANGHVAVCEMFLAAVGYFRDALVAAAANNQVAVLRLLMRRNPVVGTEALEKAIEGGHVDAIALLMEAADYWVIETVIMKVVVSVRADVLRFILERCAPNDGILRRILGKATNTKRCEIAEVALERCQALDEHFSRSTWNSGKRRRPTDVAIANAMSTAAVKGQLDMLQVLLAKGGWYAFQILQGAVLHDKWEVVRYLLQACDKQKLKDPALERYAATILEKAAADDDVEMAELLFTKCGVLVDTHQALRKAVQNNSTRILPLLATKSQPARVVHAFIAAAGRGQAELVELLLTRIGQQAIEKALEEAASYGDVATAKLLLTRCSPAAYKRIFHKAATSGSAGVVQLLLDRVDSCSINRALTSAAARGCTAVVKALVAKAEAAAISCALEAAAMESRLRVIGLLRKHCDPDGIRNAVAKAQVVGCDEVVVLLSSKKARRESYSPEYQVYGRTGSKRSSNSRVTRCVQWIL
jgi:hypothetical protein